MTIKTRIQLTDTMRKAAEFFRDLGAPHYFVGGCVRDILRGETPKDVDMITSAIPQQITDYIQSKGRRALRIGARFGTIGVKIDGQVVEITTYRKEIYDFQSRKPVVEFTDNVVADLNRRDFTINALIATMDGVVKDHVGGLDDLYVGVIRAVGNPSTRFKEDPLRILRAIRFAVRYGFTIDTRTLKAIEDRRWRLITGGVSKERIREELMKMLSCRPTSFSQLRLMWETRLWEVIFPAMQLQYMYDQKSPYHGLKLHMHSIMTALQVGFEYEKPKEVDWSDDERAIRVLSALLHDVGKPFTAAPHHKDPERMTYINHAMVGGQLVHSWAKTYKFSNAEVKFMLDTIEGHLNDDNWLRPYDKARRGGAIDQSTESLA